MLSEKTKSFLRIALTVLCASMFVVSAWAAWHDGAESAGFCMAATSILPIASMQKNKRTRLLTTITPAALPGSTRTQIPRDFVYNNLLLRMTAQVDIAAGGGADGTLNAEQPLSLIRGLQLVASSPTRPTVAEIRNADFAALYQLSHFFSGAADEFAALAAPGVQAATKISAKVEVPLYIPRCVVPRRAGLNTHELASLDLVVDWGTGQGDLIDGGTRVVTMSLATLQVHGEEFLDTPSNMDRYAVNVARYIEQPVPGATTQFRIDLKRGFLTRGVMVKQFTRAAGKTFHTPVNTIVNAVSLEVNGTPKIQYASNGLAASGWTLLQNHNKEVYGLETVPTGYAVLDLMEDGQFDSLIRTSDYTNIYLVLDVNTIADAVIRVYPLELIDTIQ